MFRKFKHKPLEVEAVEVTAEYVRSLDPEAGPILPRFNGRTGEPDGAEVEGLIYPSIGDFIVPDADERSGYRAIHGKEFRSKYDPAW